MATAASYKIVCHMAAAANAANAITVTRTTKPTRRRTMTPSAPESIASGGLERSAAGISELGKAAGSMFAS